MIALAIFALGCSGFAQSGSPYVTLEQPASNSPTAIQTGYWTFTSGSGNTYLSYCVTPNGNITYLETPHGYAQINHTYAALLDGEGYGLCDANVPTQYYDYAYGDSGNWGATSLVSQTATSMKFTRNTSDGFWTLTQTITQVAGSSSVKVVMTLKNNTAVGRTAYLVRYADINADNFNSNFGSGTGSGAFIWNNSPDPAALSQRYGLALQNVGTPQFRHGMALCRLPCTALTHALLLTIGLVPLRPMQTFPRCVHMSQRYPPKAGRR